MKREMKALGWSWDQVMTSAADRKHWRSLVAAFCVITHESNKIAVLPRTIVIGLKLHIVVAQSPI